ncbi:MAG: hypothetical protein EZS28_047891 [Streblomastix strix]|uniref:Uncharacterized protein n=1 Tax=Streblomastix strix TaxID=222440 RepID=A0A5J4TF86_9EUKA|nr:MAG: hypothetical protein EZS28_047891 [Streblomastix strix]
MNGCKLISLGYVRHKLASYETFKEKVSLLKVKAALQIKQENPVSLEGLKREKRKKVQNQLEQHWKVKDPNYSVLERTKRFSNSNTDYAAQMKQQNPVNYHDNTVEKQILEAEKNIFAPEAQNMLRTESLIKLNQNKTLEGKITTLQKTLKRDFIKSNPLLQVDHTNLENLWLFDQYVSAIAIIFRIQRQQIQ